MFGLDMTRSVIETICMSLEPVVVEMLRGLMRMSYKIARCIQGTSRCVPSPTDWGQLELPCEARRSTKATHVGKNSLETVEHDRTVASGHVVHGRVNDGRTNGEGDCMSAPHPDLSA